MTDSQKPETFNEMMARLGLHYKIRTTHGRKWIMIPLDKLKIAEGGEWNVEQPEKLPSPREAQPLFREASSG